MASSSLLWGAALFISFFTLQYWNFHGSLPGYDKRKLPLGGDSSIAIDPHKDDFSMAPHDEEAYAPVNMDERDPGRGDEYASGAYGGSGVTYSNPQDAYDESQDGTHAGGYVGGSGGTAYNSSTVGSNASGGYGGLGGGAAEYSSHSPQPQHGTGYVPPTATDYEDGPAHFPAGNYDRTLR